MVRPTISKFISDLSKSGQKTLTIQSDHLSRPLFSINRLTESGKVEQHDLATDITFILKGRGTLQRGGEIVNKTFRSTAEWRGTELINSEVIPLVPGVIIITPAGTPHKTIPSGKSPLIFTTYKQYLSDYQIEDALTDNIKAKILNIKGILMDVDGVMTDGKVWVNEKGEEAANFSRIDSLGRRKLQDRGVKLGMLSREKVTIAQARAKKLGIDCFTDLSDKVSTADLLLKKWRLSFDQICFIGDDINDLDLLQMVGFSTCPSDAAPEVIRAVDLVLPKKRGDHVLRELFDLIYQIQNSQ